MYQFISDPNAHAAHFYGMLDQAVDAVRLESSQNYLRFVKQYADVRFNADMIARRWEDMMVSLRDAYPTLESRALPKPTWSYKA